MKNIIPCLTEKAIKKLESDQKVYLKSFRKKDHFLTSLYVYEKSLDRYGIDRDDFNKVFNTKTFKKSLLDCGSWLEWNYFIKADSMKLQNANFCKRDKVCPACAVRRAYKQQVRFLQSLEDDNDLIDQDWYYIVIPVKHNIDDDFETVFNKIVDIRSKISFYLRDSKRNGTTRNFWSIFKGGMTSIETTKTDNGWNVHMNIIINAPKGTKIDIKTITNARGQKSYQNADLVSFLARVADSKMHNIQKLDFSNKDNIREALVEILKYSLKFSSLSDNDLIYIYLKTYKKRLFTTFGNLRGLDLENCPLEGDVNYTDDFVRIVMRRVNNSYYSIQNIGYEYWS